VIDPVCGMEVQPATAAAAWDHAGTIYYFCSVACMDRFRADPQRFLASEPDRGGHDIPG
jgi:Cu+-exporting ATPase